MPSFLSSTIKAVFYQLLENLTEPLASAKMSERKEADHMSPKVTISLTPEEYDRWTAAAEADHRSLAGWVKLQVKLREKENEQQSTKGETRRQDQQPHKAAE